MKLRLSNITNLTDARYAAAEGFDWLGFNFVQENAAHISSIKAHEIKGWLSSDGYFGRFSGNDIEQIKGIVALLQLHAIEIPLECFDPTLFEIVDYIFLDWEINESNILVLEPRLKALSAMGISDKIALFIHGPLKHACMGMQLDFPVYISLNQPDELEAFKNSSITGVDITGTNEEKPGFSDWEHIALLVEQIRS